MKAAKPTIFSGVQPTGNLHLGNYLGAISQWVPMQEKYNSIFCVVDYHAITIKQNPQDLNQRIIEIVKHYLAAGIDPKKSVIFQQSDVSAHTELAWVLNNIARISDLKKMTQFKDKAGKDQENVSVGLFDYPVLMAADILLYDTDEVPVGEDQKQHVELCRDLAKRFNHQFGETFKIPDVVMRKEGARIMGLDDPTKKMSKSATSPANYIALNDAPEVAAKKIMRAVTDSGSEIKFDKTDKPAIANLLTIYSLLTGQTIKELEKQYEGKGYGDFKKGLAEEVKSFLIDYQLRFNRYSDTEIKTLLQEGADKVRPLAEATLKKVKTKLGLKLSA